MNDADASLVDLDGLHVTRDVEEFARPDVGALLFDVEPGFREVEQDVLVSLVDRNRRQPFRSCDEALLQLQPDDVFMEETFATLEESKAFVHQVLDELGLLTWSGCVDIPGRLEAFSDLVGSRSLRCRFEVLSGNSCDRFHVDSIHSRLICTYAGPGTQLRLPDSEDVAQLPSGTAVIVKGTEFPEYEPVILHRSPPIEGRDVKRFLFVADDARDDDHQY